MDFIPNIRGIFKKAPPKAPDNDITSNLPTGRASATNFESTLKGMGTALKFVGDDYHKELIPIIRKLLVTNSSLSLAVVDSVQLCNPGFTINFDSETKDDQIIKMRKHLKTVTKKWGAGTPGMHGLINKLIYQLFIGGANSVEWVIKNDRSGVDFMAMLRPEDIRVAYSNSQKYTYYQKQRGMLPAAAGFQVPL
jgi:hypothetical protein